MEFGNPAPNLPDILAKSTQDRHNRQQVCRNGEFLRGPIPLSWLAVASQCGRLALTVGILLWFRKGCSGTTTGLTVSERQFTEFGLSRQTFAKGLCKLEAAGLVTVAREPGRKLRSTIITSGIVQDKTVESDVNNR